MPSDGYSVWIRRLPWYDQPVRAVWTDISGATVNVQTISLADAPVNILVPVASIHSWKFQYLEDETRYQNDRRAGDPR